MALQVRGLAPPVDAVAARTSYEHTQLNPSVTWTVQHGLGWRPGGIQVADVDGNDTEPTVQHITDNTLLLTFTDPTAGTAHIT